MESALPSPAPPVSNPNWVVIGRGRLGLSLAGALGCTLLEGRTAHAVPEGSLCLIAVPDQHVTALAHRLDGRDAAFVHLSGAYGLELLQPLASRGYAVGAFHPLQSFPEPRPPDAFAGTFFAVDASTAQLCGTLARLAERLGGWSARVPGPNRAAYHAAATMAGPLVVALVSIAVRQFERAGLERAQALSAALPYLAGTVRNLQAQRLPGALIGPVRRGDAETVRRHLEAIDAAARAAYLPLSEEALDLARAAGLGEEALVALKQVLAAPAATK